MKRVSRMPRKAPETSAVQSPISAPERPGCRAGATRPLHPQIAIAMSARRTVCQAGEPRILAKRRRKARHPPQSRKMRHLVGVRKGWQMHLVLRQGRQHAQDDHPEHPGDDPSSSGDFLEQKLHRPANHTHPAASSSLDVRFYRSVQNSTPPSSMLQPASLKTVQNKLGTRGAIYISRQQPGQGLIRDLESKGMLPGRERPGCCCLCDKRSSKFTH